MPAFFIVGKVSLACALHIREAVHYLMLVEAAVLVHLVNHEHITARWVIGQEYVNMVSIHTLCASDVAVGVVHFNAPLLAACILAASS